jgi:hypothetical protein
MQAAQIAFIVPKPSTCARIPLRSALRDRINRLSNAWLIHRKNQNYLVRGESLSGRNTTARLRNSPADWLPKARFIRVLLPLVRMFLRMLDWFSQHTTMTWVLQRAGTCSVHMTNCKYLGRQRSRTSLPMESTALLSLL